MITTLLLDVDGVLIFHAPEFEAMMDRDYAWRNGFAAFRSELFGHPDGLASLVGTVDMRTIAAGLLASHVDGLDAETLLNRWYRDEIVIDQGILDVLATTRQTRSYLATNQDSHRGAHIAKLLEARIPWLTGTLMSSDLGFAKPDPAFFVAALERIGADASECLFTDDKLANVEAAAEVGITAVHYRDVEQFSDELRRHGLLD